MLTYINLSCVINYVSENISYLNGFTSMSIYFQASDFQMFEYTQSTHQTPYLHTYKFASFSPSSADLTNWHFSVDLVGLVIKLNQLIRSRQQDKNKMIIINVHMYKSLYLITSLLMNRYCYCSYERVIVLNYSVCVKQTNCVLSY